MSEPENEQFQYSGDFDEANAQVLLELLASDITSDPVKLQIITEILEESKDTSFFQTMFNEDMSLSRCPCCGHQNHWLIPEEDLNTMGYVSSEKDVRVKSNTTVEDCPEYQEACLKKKTTA